MRSCILIFFSFFSFLFKLFEGEMRWVFVFILFENKLNLFILFILFIFCSGDFDKMFFILLVLILIFFSLLNNFILLVLFLLANFFSLNLILSDDLFFFNKILLVLIKFRLPLFEFVFDLILRFFLSNKFRGDDDEIKFDFELCEVILFSLLYNRDNKFVLNALFELRYE